MKWSFRIASVGGTEIRVHVTFFLLLIWVGARFLADDGIAQAVGGVIFVCALFGCVVLHELGHAAAARRYGIRTPDITLLPIGGLARLERMPESPAQELVIAVAGPLVNVVIAAVLFPFVAQVPTVELGFDLVSPRALFAQLMVVNLWLVVFNMIPAFPMDGGRVLRALLSMVVDRVRATNIAAGIGQVFAVAFGLLGLLAGNPFLILIAVFVFMAAGAEAASTRLERSLADVPVSAAVIHEFSTLPVTGTLRDAIDALLDGTQEDFPIIGADGKMRGMLTRRKLIGELGAHGEDFPIARVELAQPGMVEPAAKLIDLMQYFREGDSRTLPVGGGREGELVGLVTMENVSELIMVRQALEGRHAGAMDPKLVPATDP